MLKYIVCEYWFWILVGEWALLFVPFCVLKGPVCVLNVTYVSLAGLCVLFVSLYVLLEKRKPKKRLTLLKKNRIKSIILFNSSSLLWVVYHSILLHLMNLKLFLWFSLWSCKCQSSVLQITVIKLQNKILEHSGSYLII